MRATKVPLFAILLFSASTAWSETYCYNSLTGSCVAMASIFDPCSGSVVATCPSGTPAPTGTPTPRPGTPTPTPTHGATPTPTPIITPPPATCGNYVVTYSVVRGWYTLNLYCGSIECYAVWPGGNSPRVPAWQSLALSVMPTETGAIVIHGAAWSSLAEQHCGGIPLLPLNIHGM